MKYQKLSSTMLVLMLSAGVALTASAQSSGGSSGSGGSDGGKTASDMPKAGSGDSFTGWMRGQGSRNEGRISRQAYMDETGRRWDSMDTTKQGLTYDQVTGLYGYSGTGMGGPTATTPQDKAGIKQ